MGVEKHAVKNMGISQLIERYNKRFLRNQTSDRPTSECLSLFVVSGFLLSALRIWDEDHIKAKSQVKIAAAMLRGYTNELPADTEPPTMLPVPSGLAPWQVRKLKDLIDASLCSTIRLADCANQVRLSAGYFSRVFKTTFGSTFCQYIRRRRVERAQQLMLLTAQPMSEIALNCGFGDQSHYCRVFRDVVGISPSVWRRRNLMIVPEN